MNDHRLPWKLFLSRLTGVSSRQKIQLFDMFESIEDFVCVPRETWGRVLGQVRTMPEDITRAREESLEDFCKITDCLCSCLTYWDPDYPELLRQIPSPPFALFIRGDKPDFSVPAVGIVGTRDASPRGLARAFQIAGELCGSGWMVISGLARGIDLAAHQGALAAGGITGAILASGVDMVYPKSSRSTASEILARGGFFMSEYVPGSQALPARFPVRNRIIAGLCRAVIVVEAPQRSGSLITADFALDCGREVLVHSGSIGEEGNEGVTALYNQGAGAVSNREDFFNALSCNHYRLDRDLREAVGASYGQGVV